MLVMRTEKSVTWLNATAKNDIVYTLKENNVYKAKKE
jgi:hypothetical protein